MGPVETVVLFIILAVAAVAIWSLVKWFLARLHKHDAGPNDTLAQ
jgi:hypothetical protein